MILLREPQITIYYLTFSWDCISE